MSGYERLNDDRLIAVRNRHIKRLEAFFDGVADGPFVLLGVFGPPLHETAAASFEPESYVKRALDRLEEKTGVAADERAFRPLCVQFNPFATHFMDRLFGAHVYFAGESRQWYCDPLRTPVGELAEPDLDRSETWTLAKRAAEAFLAAKARLPIFALPTIASPLNIFVNLYGQEALTAFYAEPDKAQRDLSIVTRACCELHRWYLNHLPPEQIQPVLPITRFQPPGYGQICGCSTQLVSPDIYREFIAPLDHEIFSVYPKQAGMIHLCGSHRQHIAAWKEMKSMKAFQLNGGALDDFEAYYSATREDQIIYAVLDDEPAAAMESLLSISNGKRVVFSGNGARAFLETSGPFRGQNLSRNAPRL